MEKKPITTITVLPEKWLWPSLGGIVAVAATTMAASHAYVAGANRNNLGQYNEIGKEHDRAPRCFLPLERLVRVYGTTLQSDGCYTECPVYFDQAGRRSWVGKSEQG